MRGTAVVAMVGVLGLGAFAARAAGAAPTAPSAAAAGGVTAQSALESLKGLAGNWKGSTPEVPDVSVVYKVISGGTAVMETMFPNSPAEMISVYFIDGDNLRMTHYCAAGNQPRMRLDLKTSTSETLNFSLDGGTNFDPKKDMHIHSAKLTLPATGQREEVWTAYKEGKQAGQHNLVLSRVD
jgi:hypothetical protein